MNNRTASFDKEHATETVISLLSRRDQFEHRLRQIIPD